MLFSPRMGFILFVILSLKVFLQVLLLFVYLSSLWFLWIWSFIITLGCLIAVSEYLAHFDRILRAGCHSFLMPIILSNTLTVLGIFTFVSLSLFYS